jgi:hypothetical protein
MHTNNQSNYYCIRLSPTIRGILGRQIVVCLRCTIFSIALSSHQLQQSNGICKCNPLPLRCCAKDQEAGDDGVAASLRSEHEIQFARGEDAAALYSRPLAMYKVDAPVAEMEKRHQRWLPFASHSTSKAVEEQRPAGAGGRRGRRLLAQPRVFLAPPTRSNSTHLVASGIRRRGGREGKGGATVGAPSAPSVGALNPGWRRGARFRMASLIPCTSGRWRCGARFAWPL